MKKAKTEVRRNELLELFDLATENPSEAQSIIESKTKKPYSRVGSNNITRDSIVSMNDYFLSNYYQDWLYKIWNFAESRKK